MVENRKTEDERNKNGTFAIGNQIATGRPSGYQSYGARAIMLSEKYTREQIIEFANNPELAEEKLSYFDALCITHMARAIDKQLTATDSGADQVGKERQQLLDRIEGQSKVVAEVTNKNPLESMTAKEITELVDALTKHEK
jgi:hypothetical protein